MQDICLPDCKQGFNILYSCNFGVFFLWEMVIFKLSGRTPDSNVRHNVIRLDPQAACHLKNIRSPGKEVKPCEDSTANGTK